MTNLEAISPLSTEIVVLKYHFSCVNEGYLESGLFQVWGKNVLGEPGITIRLMSKNSETNLKRFLL